MPAMPKRLAGAKLWGLEGSCENGFEVMKYALSLSLSCVVYLLSSLCLAPFGCSSLNSGLRAVILISIFTQFAVGDNTSGRPSFLRIQAAGPTPEEVSWQLLFDQQLVVVVVALAFVASVPSRSACQVK